MVTRIIVFALINFGALAVGSFFTGKGVPSEWYAELNKAPWTPPGWVFGGAWTTIMICFSFYLAYLWPLVESKALLVGLFTIQLILNIGWNPVFFHLHQMGFGLIVISLLTLVVGLFLILYWSKLKFTSLLIAPYLIWLIIATSLNAFAWLKN